MVNEGNAYGRISAGAFPGRWKRLHGMRGIPDYLVWVPKDKKKPITRPERQFFVEVKEIEDFPASRFVKFRLDLRPGQVAFFSKKGGWPGEKYVLVRSMKYLTWKWFSGEELITCTSREIAGPFKRD